MTRRQLTDKQWQLIEPFLPIGEYGPYPERLRDQFEGVIWRFRTGAQWREMPGEFGPWPTVYGRFRVWRNAGVFTGPLSGPVAVGDRRPQPLGALGRPLSRQPGGQRDPQAQKTAQGPHGCPHSGTAPGPPRARPHSRSAAQDRRSPPRSGPAGRARDRLHRRGPDTDPLPPSARARQRPGPGRTTRSAESAETSGRKRSTRSGPGQWWKSSALPGSSPGFRSLFCDVA